MNNSIIRGFLGVLISPSRGILIYSPILIFGFIGALLVWFEKDRHRLLPYMSISLLLALGMISMYRMWWGGWTFGYRILLEIVPLLVIFFLYYLQALPVGNFMRVIMVLLIVYSIFVQVMGVYTYPSDFCFVPDDIHFHQERLWDFPDTELTRCAIKFMGQARHFLGLSR